MKYLALTGILFSLFVSFVGAAERVVVCEEMYADW